MTSMHLSSLSYWAGNSESKFVVEKKQNKTQKPIIRVKHFSRGRTAVHLVGQQFQQRKSKNRDVHISSSKDMFQFRSEKSLNRTEGH